MGNANFTCTEAALDEQCTTLNTGEKVSYDIFVKFQTKISTIKQGRLFPPVGEDKSLLPLCLFPSLSPSISFSYSLF